MFERFTERARQVVVLACDEAQLLHHTYIGTEHILLGLLREEEGLAARVLESLNVTVKDVEAQVRRVVGEGDHVTAGQIPFTPRAKRALELSLREALSLGHGYIGTEHVLLGLVRVADGVAMRILLDFDADAEKIRNEIIRMLSGPRPEEPLDPELRAEIERLRAEKEAAIEAKDFERAAALRDRERQVRFGTGEHPRELRPPRRPSYGPRIERATLPLVLGWLLFAVALGVGLLLGWLIWG